jgi:hypothetical protein
MASVGAGGTVRHNIIKHRYPYSHILCRGPSLTKGPQSTNPLIVAKSVFSATEHMAKDPFG